MKYRDAATFRRDLEQRLAARCDDDRLSVDLARREVVFDRLLARLAAAAPGRWVVSGDQALAMRFPSRPRNDWNIDLEWLAWGDEAVDRAMLQVTEPDAGDFFEFDVEQAGEGVSGTRGWSRYRVSAVVGPEEFSTVSLTLHSRYQVLPAECLLTAGLLEFADVGPVAVDAVLLEIHAAELLCDHVGECETGLNPSDLGRLRDLALIAAQSGLDATTLVGAIAPVFAWQRREIPAEMPHPFEGWVEWMREMAATAGRPEDFLPGYEGVVSLFGPILSGEVDEGTWDATAQAWLGPGSALDGQLPFA